MKSIPGNNLVIMLINDRVTDRRAVQQAMSLREAGFRVEFVSWRHGEDDAVQVDGFLIRRIEYAAVQRHVEKQGYRSYLRPQEIAGLLGVAAHADSHFNELLSLAAHGRDEAGVSFNHIDALAQGLVASLGLPHLAVRLPQTKLLLRQMANRVMHAKLHAIYAQEKVYAVQSHDVDAGWMGLRLSRSLGVPLVFDAHEAYLQRTGLSRIFRRYYARVEPLVMQSAAFWMTVNGLLGGWVVEDYAAHGVRVPEPMILENAAPYRPDDSKSRGLRDRLSIGDGERIVLYQGGVAPRRNIESVVRLAGYLDARWKVVVLGDGKYANELAVQAGRLAGVKIHFLKAVPQAELMACTASADVGLIPYKAVDVNTRFCSPNKMYEFIQAGVPCVANELPFLSEKINRLHSGWLTDFENPEGVAALLNKLTDGEIEKKRQNVLRAKHAESWEKHAVRYVERMKGLSQPA